MKKLLVTLCLLLVFSLVLSPLGYAAGDNYDTLADWNIKIAVPDGVTAVLKGNEYYLYAQKAGSIPYVMLTTFRFDSEAKFIPAFTEYMQKQHADLQVTDEARKVTVGDKSGYEIDYAYKVSGYDVKDRRIVMTVDGLTYVFTSKEVPARNMTVGTMLEDVIANCEFLSKNAEPLPGLEEETVLADAYLYCQKDGMPKYWLDLTGAMADTLALHCYFRSGEPTFYEAVYFLDLDTADVKGSTITVHDVYNANGFDYSHWFKSLTIRLADDGAVMTVKRDESTLAGGPEDNILSGVYLLEPRTYPLPAEEGPFTEEELARWAQIYYFTHNGFFPPEADVEQNADGSFTIHLYEIVKQDGTTHTATSAWYTVDAYGEGVEDITEQEIRLCA